MDLHRALLHAEARKVGIADEPYKMLAAALGDERFAWLKPLSDLIVTLDEAGAQGTLPDNTALAPFVAKARDLTAPGSLVYLRAGALAPEAPGIREAQATLADVLGMLGA
ncbi:hypothetical protein [Acidisoma sp. L85]|jgi:hypothetical protein|nr:hypothetical protein [Acidisoma sp. L85]